MSWLTSVLRPPRPVIGIEFAADRVTVVRLGAGTSPVEIAGYAVEALPPGALVPSLNATNLVDRAAVVGALTRACERAGVRGGYAALVVPDPVAKVSLLRFDQIPPRASDLTELIKWQVKKTVPFPIEDAQIAHVPGAPVEGAHEFVVVVSRRDVVVEYERAAQEAGVQPGVVDVATLNQVNAVLAGDSSSDGDWLLVHAAPDYLTLAILRQDQLIFLRHRGSDDDTTLADVVHQTAMYYEDRLHGTGFRRVIVAGASGREKAGPDGIRRELEARLQSPVQTIDPRPAVALTDRIGANASVLDSLAPAVGLLLRERAS